MKKAKEKKVSYNVKLVSFKNQNHIKVYSRSLSRLSAFEKANRELMNESSDVWTVRRFYSARELENEISRSILSSKNRTVNTVYNYALSNDWTGFVTLTFDPKLIDSSNYDLVSGKMKNWLGNIRRLYCPDLKYIVVPELHRDKKKFHFHALFHDFGQLPLADSGHTDKKGRIIYNLPLWNYGFSTLTLVQESDSAVSYILKYISKDLCTQLFNRKRFWASRNLARPDERELLLPHDDIQDILSDMKEDIRRAKTVDVPSGNNRVEYYYCRRDF